VAENLDLSNPKNIAKLISKTGVIEILHFIEKNKTARYSDLISVVSSEPTLTRRLVELSSIGVLERIPIDKRQRLIKYSLSENGKKILSVINGIEKNL
jgi:DNA-binding HxlR family transcriptional regulator